MSLYAGWAGAPCVSVRGLFPRRICASANGTAITAGAGAYYFAKQEINADRRAKLEQARKKKQDIQSLEYSVAASGPPASSATTNGSPARTDSAGSPSQEASNDPAPTRHAPATESERVREKSKYESSVPYRSPKGDRFS
ncbi:Calcium homeostasis endoplasmic reticulum protein [Tolypocladium capitatum]|uniref:Calcium homeostasis endoplasmic reticulum protein n=1 Tax=Tolypocladium capitatum TaxID=45235 RepID=A0A2K3QF37_9HYPO|nr:Calcium homeostasis endoplasmic reticulum protein [Tolypocladium capitatum]